MEVCDGSAILAYAVTCSEVRQLRNEEAVSDAEAMERWLGDRGKSNFEKMWILFRLPRFGTRMCFAPRKKRTQRFVQLAIRNSWLSSLLASLARVMGHESFHLATTLQRFLADGRIYLNKSGHMLYCWQNVAGDNRPCQT